MPYFIRIGREARNLGGTKSAGYCIWRSGRTVHREYGAVDVDGKRGGQAYWRGPNLPVCLKNRFRTADLAQGFMSDKLDELRWKRYEKLPGNRSIRSYRFHPHRPDRE